MHVVVMYCIGGCVQETRAASHLELDGLETELWSIFSSWCRDTLSLEVTSQNTSPTRDSCCDCKILLLFPPPTCGRNHPSLHPTTVHIPFCPGEKTCRRSLLVSIALLRHARRYRISTYRATCRSGR